MAHVRAVPRLPSFRAFPIETIFPNLTGVCSEKVGRAEGEGTIASAYTMRRFWELLKFHAQTSCDGCSP
jgi:hypothetical protein